MQLISCDVYHATAGINILNDGVLEFIPWRKIFPKETFSHGRKTFDPRWV